MNKLFIKKIILKFFFPCYFLFEFKKAKFSVNKMKLNKICILRFFKCTMIGRGFIISNGWERPKAAIIGIVAVEFSSKIRVEANHQIIIIKKCRMGGGFWRRLYDRELRRKKADDEGPTIFRGYWCLRSSRLAVLRSGFGESWDFSDEFWVGFE